MLLRDDTSLGSWDEFVSENVVIPVCLASESSKFGVVVGGVSGFAFSFATGCRPLAAVAFRACCGLTLPNANLPLMLEVGRGVCL